jgi:hypothetical protein
MKKITLLLSIFLCSKISIAQIDSSEYRDHSFWVFKTEEDFFLKKRIYRGQIEPQEDTKIIKYKTLNSKKRTLNLEDSCSFYFGYGIGDEIQIRPSKDPRSFTYYSFGGGNRDIYCVVYGHLGNYDKKGYLQGLTSPGGTLMYFVDRTHNLYMVQLTEFLKSKPILLAQFKAEKAKLSELDWDRNKLNIGIKYLKLFIGEGK